MDATNLIFTMIFLVVVGLTVGAIVLTTPKVPRALFAAPVFAYAEMADDEFERHAGKGFPIGDRAKSLWLTAVLVGFAGGVLSELLAVGLNVDGILFRVPLIVLVGFLGAAAFRAGMANKKVVQAEIDKGSGPYALFLRSFAFDGSTVFGSAQLPGAIGGNRIKVSFEEMLGAICHSKRIGLKAIGKKGGLGPTAIETTDEQWRHVAQELMPSAKLIILVPIPVPILVPAVGSGLFWEIQQVASSDMLLRVVWLMPPDSSSRSMIAEEWQQAAETIRTKVGLPFPDYHGEGALFAFAIAPDGKRHLDIRPYSDKLLARVVHAAANGPPKPT
ncbi:MAG: hypothetical protein ABMA14_23430 [Hyphomonadaceae bacterium]